MAHYTILIKNGTVLDGKGSALQELDIGIKDEKIKKIGNLHGDTADRVIDAKGKYVCPGFIDLGNHSDTHWTLFLYPEQESMLRQGVTTILGGICGSSLAPLVKAKDIEGIQKWVNVSDININWRTMGEFFKELESHKFGVNVCTLVGHNTLRRGVINNEVRALKPNEARQIQNLLEESINEGAFGLSTSLGSAHSRSASDDEIVGLLKIVAKKNAISCHHLEDEGKNLLPALSRLISLARLSGSRIHISHFKAIGKTAWESWQDALNMFERARKENIQATCDVFPYTRTGSNLYMLLPEWVLEGGKERILQTIAEKRQEVIKGLQELTLHYDRITVASTLHDTASVGKTILQLSNDAGVSCEEIILNLLEVNKLRVAIFNEVISEQNIERLIKQDYAMIGSDGVGVNLKAQKSAKKDLPHPRSFGAFPRVLAYFVREKNILSWEEAIYKMSGFPAQVLGIKDRGVIEPGAYADMVIFDPNAITDLSTYDNPFQFPQGIEYVLVNGGIAVDKNGLTGQRLGKVIRRK